ncbi:hypothetical protein CNMCM8812_007889 [Aspergillus fumigatus]|nr:hypothetical protein CNMCM8812_007889 [Aspergillus fumigatus]
MDSRHDQLAGAHGRTGGARSAGAGGPPLAGVQVAVAQVLRSGDLDVYTHSASDRARLSWNEEAWLRELPKGEHAYIINHQYAVLVHHVPITYLPSLSAVEALREKILLRYPALCGPTLHVGWCGHDAAARQCKRKSSLVVSFRDAHTANHAIQYQIFLDGTPLRTELFDPLCRLLQCTRCLNYGHAQPVWTAARVSCLYCANALDKKFCKVKGVLSHARNNDPQVDYLRSPYRSHPNTAVPSAMAPTRPTASSAHPPQPAEPARARPDQPTVPAPNAGLATPVPTRGPFDPPGLNSLDAEDAGPGTLSLEEKATGSMIDLAFVSWGLIDHVTHVREANLDSDSDHLPIEIELDAAFAPMPPKQRRNWAAMDPQKLAATLTAHMPLPARATDTEASTAPGEVDQFLGQLVNAINTAIDEAVPWLRPSLYSRSGFTPVCRALLREKKRVRWAISAYRSKYHHEAPLPLRAQLAQTARACKRAVQRCRRRAFRQQITEITDMEDVWRAVRWTKNRGPYQAYTPLFGIPVLAYLDDLRGYDYPEPLSVPEFKEHEVLCALRSVKPDKAPGPDRITNRALQAAGHVLVPCLTGLYNQCIRLGYCPEHFRDAATIALRKPGKPDLLSAKGLLEALIASRMSYLAEAHGLLPDNHFGGRRGQGTENALHAALEAIHSGWKNGKVVSALLLDISGAFDNVSHDRLLHNLRTRRIPQAYVTWLGSFLRGRSTSLVLPEYTLPTRRVETGIPQGSPLSPILYKFYNAGLMGRGAPEWGTDNIGYIDDTTMLATGDSEHANCQRLREHYRRGCLCWAATHASRFEPSKFQLIHFHPPGQGPRGGPGEPLNLGDGQIIEASATARLLGVILDQRLTFESHLKHVDTAATRRLQAISALGGSKWGLRLRELRHVYTACITPIMLYAASVWYAPPVRGRKRLHSQQTKVLNQIQRRAGKLIAGAFRTVKDLEIRLLWAVPPWWESPEVVIEATKERSLLHHNIHCIAYPEAIRIYTNGSGICGRVDTAAVCLGPPSAVNVTWGRSTDVEHTVPVAEMAGLAALRTLLAPKQAAGQYLVQELVDLIDQLNLVLDILFHWLAAHHGIAGNGLAGQKAKEAAGWRRGVTDGRCGPLAPVMMLNHPTRGPLDAWIKQHVKEQWGEAWRQSEHGRHLRRYLPGLTRHSFAIYNDLTPMERSVLAQMRTGKIGLAPETIHHVLFGCTQYDDLRRATWTEGAPRDLTEALTEKQYVRRAARFMLNTGRLMYLAEATEPAWLEPIAPSSERLPTALAGDG